MPQARATVAILSIGDMGAGVARLLSANGYRVITSGIARSEATQKRIESCGVDVVSTDVDLINQADYILSIVPPLHAGGTGSRVSSMPESYLAPRERPICYLDLNAVSPKAARWLDSVFATGGPKVNFIDGGIIGGPPRPKEDGSWYRPSIVVSGPIQLSDMQPSGAHLAEVLNMKHLNDDIGSASGLKMCFAGLGKGFTALAIQSFTTAHNLGVLPELQEHLKEYSPLLGETANRGLASMPPKAYRWIYEQMEIADTYETDGGFFPEENIFKPIAAVYEEVAYGTELGKEKTDSRQRGKTAEDVALLMSEGLAKRKVKEE